MAYPPQNPSALFFVPGILLPVVNPINDGFNLVSNVAESSWNIVFRASASVATSWNITGMGVTTTGAIAWNVTQRTEAVQLFGAYGLDRPVVFPIRYNPYIPAVAWNLDRRTFAVQATSWNIIDRKNSNKVIAWNIYNIIFKDSPVSWNVLRRVYVPGVSLELYPGLLQPVVHPIDMTTTLPAPNIAWNLAQRVRPSKVVKWNVLFATKALQRSSFNTLATHVTSTIAASWNLLGKVIQTGQISWALQERYNKLRAVNWNVRIPAIAQKATSWKVFGKVTNTFASSWALIQRPFARQRVTWNTFEHVSSYVSSYWGLTQRVAVIRWQLIPTSPGSIATSVVHPIDVINPGMVPVFQYGLSSPVVHPIDWTFQTGFGSVPYPQIAWRLGINPAGRVTKQGAISWNLYNKVVRSYVISWNMVGRSSSSVNVLFNTLTNGTSTVRVTWIVGSPLQGQIRQTVIDRTDFTY